MHAYLTTSPPTGGPTRGYPAHSIREGRTTGRVQRKFEQDSDSVPFLSRTPNRRPSQRKSHNRPTSPSSFDNSSDDDIIGPITPPPILRDLALYSASAVRSVQDAMAQQLRWINKRTKLDWNVE
ncbi:hypothetical protein P692DRAFT_20883693 [Suillus brevipes Sb2]|nr:hypothetical protein P692DRAFT_20883693 [Suillus brevipes Sb2]